MTISSRKTCRLVTIAWQCPSIGWNAPVMNGRAIKHWLVGVIPCISFFVFFATGSGASGAENDSAIPSRPNVLLIILDDQNGFAGHTDLAPQPVTPNLDRLAKRGVTFANAQCAAPVCNPSRTALL